MALLRALPVVICLVFVGMYLLVGRDVTAEELLNYAPQKPILAAFFLLLLYALKSLTIFFPIAILNVLGGFLFGSVDAIAINCIGVLVELTIPYWIGRVSGRSIAQRLELKHPKMASLFGERSGNLFFLSFFLRALFCLPGDAVSMYFGAIKMPYHKYIVGSIIGILPGTIAFTLLGTSITDPSSAMFRFSLCLTIGFSIISFVLYSLWKRRKNKKCENNS